MELRLLTETSDTKSAMTVLDALQNHPIELYTKEILLFSIL